MTERAPQRNEVGNRPGTPETGAAPAQQTDPPVENTAETAARRETVAANLDSHAAAQAQGPEPATVPIALKKNTGGHHEDGAVKWAKRGGGLFGYLFNLVWQGLKRWGEMAGKGGGGHAKKDDHGHGGH